MYNGKRVIHIVACGAKGEIGKDNSLLWSIPEDLRFFRESTLGHVVLMGRKTFESLPKALSRRVVIKASKKYDCTIEDWLEECTDSCDLDLNTDCIFIAGGGQIYKATEPYVDEVWLTQVYANFDADTFYEVPEGFEEYQETPMRMFVDHKTGKFVGVKWLKLKKVSNSIEGV